MILQKSEQDEKFEPVFGKRLFYESDLNGERIIERKKQDVTREEGAEWNPEKECVPPHRTARTHIWYSERDYTFYSARRPPARPFGGKTHIYLCCTSRAKKYFIYLGLLLCLFFFLAPHRQALDALWYHHIWISGPARDTSFVLFLFLIKNNVLRQLEFSNWL